MRVDWISNCVTAIHHRRYIILYQKPVFHSEMRLFDPNGERLYLTKKELKAFLHETKKETPINRMYCHLLYYTGCRSSEALQLTMDRVDLDNNIIRIKTLKQRKTDSYGRIKHPKYRDIPVPECFIESLDLVFGIRQKQKKGKDKNTILWVKCRTTMYRVVKVVMERAGINGAMATCKGLRHSYGISRVTADKPVQLHVLSQLMGHTCSKITEVYLQFRDDEYIKMVNDSWE